MLLVKQREKPGKQYQRATCNISGVLFFVVVVSTHTLFKANDTQHFQHHPDPDPKRRVGGQAGKLVLYRRMMCLSHPLVVLHYIVLRYPIPRIHVCGCYSTQPRVCGCSPVCFLSLGGVVNELCRLLSCKVCHQSALWFAGSTRLPVRVTMTLCVVPNCFVRLWTFFAVVCVLLSGLWTWLGFVSSAFHCLSLLS